MAPSIRELVSRNLRWLRADRQLRIADVAEGVGVGYRQVQDWLSDADWASNPSDENLERLAALFEVEPAFFLTDNPQTRGA